MEDVTRNRILRKLESLPEAQLYQVLDYIEFMEAKYAAAASRKPDAFQQFAERIEDQMRVRALAPKAMKGTMKVMSTAGKVLSGVRGLGRDLVSTPDRSEPEGSAATGATEVTRVTEVAEVAEVAQVKPEPNGDGGRIDPERFE